MIECQFCGAENEDTREACWNCFAPLKGEAAAAMKARIARVTEAAPSGEAAPSEEAPVVKARRGISRGWLVGIVLILLIGGGGFVFYREIFQQKPKEISEDFVNAFVQGVSSQDLSLIKPYIDPVDAATLPTDKQEIKKTVTSYLRSMGVSIPEKVAGMDIMDLVSSLKPTVQSLSVSTESTSLNEAKVRVQASLIPTGTVPPMLRLPSLEGSATLTLVRQGLDWKVSLSKSFLPPAGAPVGNIPAGNIPAPR